MAENAASSKSVARPLPWQMPVVPQLDQAWRAHRLPHALLLYGREGTGKATFASWLAAAVLCERSGQGSLDACGECASCLLVAAGSHPDLILVVPEEDKQQISIDQIRSATERLSTTSYRSGYKVALIDPVHQLTAGAANSLLKTLEEPPLGSLLVLVTDKPSALLPTVRSRCQKMALPAPSLEQAERWIRAQTSRTPAADLLYFVGGAPLKALRYAEGAFDVLHEEMREGLSRLFSQKADVTQLAGEWADERLNDRLMWVDVWLTSLARAALLGNADRITFPTGPVPLPSSAGPLNISGIYRLVDRARNLKAQLSRTALQRELAVASWLIALMETLMPATVSTSRGQAPQRNR